MEKSVILSSNDKPNYINYLPYVQKAWNNLGWKTITLYLGDKNLISDSINKIIKIEHINGYRSETVVQVARLMGYKYTDGLIMTSDVDMMPLSNYWSPSEDLFTCYGADLMKYREYPICYIAAPRILWQTLIPEDSLCDLLKKFPNAKSNNFNEWWSTDQQIITKRLNLLKEKFGDSIINYIDRGQRYYWFHGKLPNGRVDRANWMRTLKANGIKIDAHLPRPYDINVAKYLLEKFHGIDIEQ